MKRVVYLVTGVVIAGILLATGQWVTADSFSSTNYRINGVLGNSFSASTSSGSYRLESSGGESIIGNGLSSTHYKLGEGYVSQLERSLTVSLASSTVSFGTVIAGSSVSVDNNITVATDYSAYNLSVHQSANLTSGANTIPAVSGSIASPVTWNEGTTKGLGFSLSSASAAGTLDSKWGGGTAYAAFPTSPTDTTFYNRNAISQYVSDAIGFRYRLDVAPSQAPGTYTNSVTITCAATL